MLHLAFTDGSNPYVFRASSRKAIMRELAKWKRNYIITGVYTRMGIYFGIATLKPERTINLFNF